ncbi:MAG: hypothetical protein ACRDTF_06345 [Pseudonocardiaceae bacterium]
MGEGHGEINHEAQDHVFVGPEAPREGQRVGGQRSGAGTFDADTQGDRTAVLVADRG